MKLKGDAVDATDQLLAAPKRVSRRSQGFPWTLDVALLHFLDSVFGRPVMQLFNQVGAVVVIRDQLTGLHVIPRYCCVSVGRTPRQTLAGWACCRALRQQCLDVSAPVGQSG